MKTNVMIGLLFASVVAIAGLSWRCVMLQKRCDQMDMNCAYWHKSALLMVESTKHDWIVIDTQERKLEETPEVVQFVCQQGGGTLRYCTQLTAPITAQLTKMHSDLESMRRIRDGAISELEKLERTLPAPRYRVQ